MSYLVLYCKIHFELDDFCPKANVSVLLTHKAGLGKLWCFLGQVLGYTKSYYCVTTLSQLNECMSEIFKLINHKQNKIQKISLN